MTRAATPLVGRDRELAVLERLVERTAGGSPGLAVIWGEPGIGKTSLLAELAHSANARDFLVLEGRAAEFERGVPFGAIVGALDDYLASVDTASVERLAGDGLGELAGVFPSLRPLSSGAQEATGAAERFRIHHAIRELLERLGARQPVLLAIDDVHWADNATLELIGYLLRRNARGRVLVVTALRTGQATPQIMTAIESAVREGAAEEISPGPLRAADAERLLEAVEPASRKRLYEESGGNPFYLEQLARGRGAVRGTASGDVPSAVAATIASELQVLSGPGRNLAEAGAVAGDPFEIDLATEVAELTESDAMTALDELASRGIAASTELPREFRFRHPLVRHAIYAAIPAGSRLSAHQRASAALARRGATASSRAHHVEAAAQPGDAEAIAVLTDAGESVASSDPGCAARWFASALRLTPERRGDADRLSLMVARGSALAAAGKPVEAVAVLAGALDELPPDAIEMRVALTVACSTFENWSGRFAAAQERILKAVELAPPESAELARLQMLLTAITGFDGRYGQMEDWANAAVRTAAGQDNPAVRAKARVVLAYAQAQAGEVGEALANRERAAAEFHSLEDSELAFDLDGVLLLATLSYRLWLLRESFAETGRGLDAARGLPQGQVVVPMLLVVRAAAELRLGRVERAISRADDAIDAAILAGDRFTRPWALGVRGRAAYLAGDMQAALSIGEESLEVAGATEHVELMTFMGGFFAPTLLDVGQAERARTILLEHGGGDELPAVPAMQRPMHYGLLAATATALGSREEAEIWLQRTEAEAARLGLPIPLAHARLAGAGALADRGEHEAAAEAAMAGVPAAEECGALVEAAQLRIVAGRSLAETGRSDDAISELEAAEKAMRDAGAERLRAEAARELRRLGRQAGSRVPVATGDGAGLDALSGREREVATLVRDRRTNPQIAEELFVSLKTVETHMRNIFRKLEVSSRVQVASIVEREERAAPRE
jgi:ATP/maltotriose-dependent transcriptional regulator MalT